MRQPATLVTLALFLLGSPLTNIATAAPSAKIIGGDNATIDAPWMSGLHSYDPDAGTYSILTFCGGSLIAPSWVVTAAHCLEGGVTAETLLVRVDNPDLGPIHSPPIPPENQPQYFVDVMTVHPSYTNFLNGFDIALLKLDTPSSATPISIADQTLMNQLNINGNTTNAVDILGWGVYDGDGTPFSPDQAANGPRPRLLQQATLDFLPLSNYRGDDIPANVVLAQKRVPRLDQPNGVDTCFGDSGGPLLVPADRTIGTLTRNMAQLIGITSFGNSQCNSTNESGAYTRAASYTDWIELATADAGDPLSDLRVQLNGDYHDILPDSDTVFSVTVFNDSSRNDVANFSLTLQTDSNDSSLEPSSDISLACTPAGLSTLNCTSTAALNALSEITYQFTVNDQQGDPRAANVKADITAQEKDDYRLANNSDTFSINYTDGPDVGINIENINMLYGKFDIVARNRSDFFAANNVSVTFTSDVALEWNDTSECAATSDFSVTCITSTLAPLAEINRTITLPANTSLNLNYEIDVSVTHDGPDNNGVNDSDDATIIVLPSNQRPTSFVASSSSGGGSAAWLLLVIITLLTSAGFSRLHRQSALLKS